MGDAFFRRHRVSGGDTPTPTPPSPEPTVYETEIANHKSIPVSYSYMSIASLFVTFSFESAYVEIIFDIQRATGFRIMIDNATFDAADFAIQSGTITIPVTASKGTHNVSILTTSISGGTLVSATLYQGG